MAKICFAKVRQNFDIPVGQNKNPYPIDSDIFHKEPGIQVVNSVNKLQKGRSIPILVVNTTIRTVNVSRNTIIVKIENMDKMSKRQTLF